MNRIRSKNTDSPSACNKMGQKTSSFSNEKIKTLLLSSSEIDSLKDEVYHNYTCIYIVVYSITHRMEWRLWTGQLSTTMKVLLSFFFSKFACRHSKAIVTLWSQSIGSWHCNLMMIFIFMILSVYISFIKMYKIILIMLNVWFSTVIHH